MPCRQNTWLVNSFAVSKAVGSLGRAMKWAAFEKRSTMVRMTDGGGPVIKSSAMCDQGFQGTGSGLRRPAGGELDTFFCAQLGQADTNSGTSRARDGHQKKCCINVQVRFLPRWQENFVEWAHWITWPRTAVGRTRAWIGFPPLSVSFIKIKNKKKSIYNILTSKWQKITQKETKFKNDNRRKKKTKKTKTNFF